MDGALTFAARVKGETVACGAGLVIPQHRVFAVCGAGTAAEAGCEYAVVVTQGGTASQRNCERLGFCVAYSKVTVIKELEKG
jgi:hypothetical protein